MSSVADAVREQPAVRRQLTASRPRGAASQSPRRRWRWTWLAGVVIVILLYSRLDAARVVETLARVDGRWFALAMLLFVPQMLVSAARWRQMVEGIAPIQLRESLRQVLCASAWNLLLPAKLGDLGKAGMIPCDNVGQRARAAGAAVMEKLSDVVSLLVLASLGWLGGSFVACMAIAIVAAGWIIVGRRAPWLGWCLMLWILHLAQIDCLFRAAGVDAPWSVMAANVPWAIFAGLLPFSPWGVGTRDAAIVYLFADVAPASTLAAVGLLTGLRYLVPGVAGLPLALRSASRSAAPSENTA